MHAKYLTLLGMSFVLLSGCSSKYIEDSPVPKHVRERRRDRDGKLFGEDGVTLWGADRRRDVPSGAGGGSGIGVNAHLWYAALDTISFVSISSADPFGGVIITEWYTPKQNQSERIKLNIFILSRLLRSDAIRVAVFHEKWDQKMNNWVATPADKKMATELENLILTRARQLKVNGSN